MAEIVNLKRHRKRLAREDKETKAQENRERFGRSKAERRKSGSGQGSRRSASRWTQAPELMPKEFKRSLTISGHRTSLSLEPEFWMVLKTAAQAERKSLAALVAEIDRQRGERNLSSALRVWVLNRLMKN